MSRGHIWAEKDDYRAAIADYTEAIRIDPQDEVAYYSRGDAWCLKEQYDKALADFDEAIRVEPGYVSAYRARGLTWSLTGKFDKALADFDEALRIDPKCARRTAAAPGSGPLAPMPGTETASGPSHRRRVPAS